MKKQNTHFINLLKRNKRKFIYSILIIFVLFTFLPLVVTAVEYADSRGKDFWLTYIPNYHNYKNDTKVEKRLGDSLYIFLTSEVPTKGVITYYDNKDNKFTHNFIITNPKVMYIFKVCNVGFELEGYNNSGSIVVGRNNSCEDISRQAFHIESDEDISVYAHNQANTTSDAFLVLPVESIGLNYYIMSYTSDGSSYPPNNVTSSSTPSQFAIVATQDSTIVQITPKTATRVNGLSVQSILLNQGDVYLVQADITYGNERSDLTGSEILSNKPISVFSGHQRATVPVYTDYQQASRDILVEQLPAVSTWGKSAYLIPYIQSPDASKKGNDLYRILAAFDSTDVYINGVLTRTLKKGEFYEGLLTSPAEVKATGSILVAQFKKTAQDQSGFFPNSDPFMMIIPPKEQFLNSYRFINVQSYEFRDSQFEKVYNQQYVTVVAPDASLSSIRLDGKAVPTNSFVKIGTTNYSYSHIVTSDGVHEISANGNFGIMVYGYGEANSYGYIGGMSFKPLDFQKPKIAAIDSCFKVNGFIHDTSLTDSHLEKVYIEPNSEVNVVPELFPKQDNPSIARFRASLIDVNYDGKFKITAFDSSGLKSTFDIGIPGFTLAFKGFVGSDSILTLKKFFRVNKLNTFYPEIINYGLFPQRLEGISSLNKNISNISGFPVVFSSGESLVFDFSVSSAVDTILYDTLSIWNDCYTKKIMALEIHFVSDKNNPVINVVNDPCKTKYDLIITDSLAWDYGIDKINILNKENCNINISDFKSSISKMNIDIIDPLQDAYFAIEVTDSIGNKSYFSDTIPGFTITVDLNSNSENKKYFDFGRNQLANLLCKEIKIDNYGNFDIVFDNAKLSQNLEFTFPQSQFPFLVKSKSSSYLTACFYPRKLMKDQNKDTLTLFFKCLTNEIILSGNSDSLILSGESRCNIGMKLFSTQIPFDYFVESIYPNPSSGIIKVNVGIPVENEIGITFYDNLGNELQNNKQILKLSPGIYELSINASYLENGVYFVRFNNGFESTIRKFIINK